MGLGSLVILLAMLTLMTTGCGEQEKQQIAALQNQYNDLSVQNKQLRDQLSLAETDKSQLTSQLQSRKQEIATRDQEIAGLRTKLAQKPTQLTAVASQGHWDIGSNADKITLGSDILFASGRATLSSQGKKALSKVVRDLKSSYSGMPIRVVGYTDSDPISKSKKLWKDNLDLSANRAMAVSRYLIANKIPEAKIETIGMGKTHQLARNNSRTNKAKNRRVEIIVVKR